jgi:trigger factor
VQVQVVVKQVQEKVLPETTDEWASEASEFSTVAELRQDIETRMSELKRVQASLSLRNGALEALVALVDEEPPTVLVDAEVRRSAEELGRRLDSQGVRLERYLEATGRTLEDLIAELRTQAIPTVKADLALRAVAEAVGIEPSESELDTFMEAMAAGSGIDANVFREQVERAGRRLAVRSDLKKSKAFDWLVEHAEVTDEEGNGVDQALLVSAGQGTELSSAGAVGVASDEPGEAE